MGQKPVAPKLRAIPDYLISSWALSYRTFLFISRWDISCVQLGPLSSMFTSVDVDKKMFTVYKNKKKTERCSEVTQQISCSCTRLVAPSHSHPDQHDLHGLNFGSHRLLLRRDEPKPTSSRQISGVHLSIGRTTADCSFLITPRLLFIRADSRAAEQLRRGQEEGRRGEISGDEGEKAKGGGGGGEYGTFQGPPSYPPPRPPVVGYPQPVPPPGLFGQHDHYSRNRGGYQAVTSQDYEAGVRGHRHDRLPCCGIGIGWFLFITSFFLGVIPWYVGAFLLWCSRVDYREKPGYVACTIAAVLATVAVIIGATAGAHVY